jgi:cytochrome c biogenesis protein CcdA/thiol-disulfide isomerase/thioredoxin
VLILIPFAFLAGIATILSPCILPVLPIILSASVSGGHRRPLGTVLGFVASFTFFTLFLSRLVSTLGISAESLRLFSIGMVGVLGVSLLLPLTAVVLERIFSSISNKVPVITGDGFGAGVLVGLSLGLLWTPCVGPILAAVISLALGSGSVGGAAVAITLAYALGTGLPMLFITYGGHQLLQKVPWLLRRTPQIQKGFGILMIVLAVGLYEGVDRYFQVWVLERFPQYGAGLTKLEDTQVVKDALDRWQMGGSTLQGRPAPELIAGGQWLNSPPLKLSELRGKVVLVDFWTYSCINCIRTLPYLRAWDEKYRDRGLVIIGVHSPEFEFEKELTNVSRAVSDFGLKYPIMQDNNFATWRAYANRYWPAKYLVDAKGHIRYSHFGEGKYDETESQIQKLLSEAGQNVAEMKVANPTYETEARTPETYLGSDRVELLSNQPTAGNTYQLPSTTQLHFFSLGGVWQLQPQFAAPAAGGVLRTHFQAKDLYLVMRPTKEAKKIKVEWQANSLSPGRDVIKGEVLVDEDRLYHLVTADEAVDAEVILTFPEGGVELFAFTFG